MAGSLDFPSPSGTPVAWLVCGPRPPFPLYVGSRAVLGRAKDADLRFGDTTISRVHALVEVDAAGAVHLEDRSTYGTFLNGRRVKSAIAHPGDTIELGTHVLTIVDGSPDGAEAGLTLAPGALKLRKGADEGLVGTLDRTPLAELLQSFEFHRNSGVLSLEHEEAVGRIVIGEGTPLSAEFHGERGREAVVRMLELRGGRFAFVPGARTKTPTSIRTTFAAILADVDSRRDLDEFVRADAWEVPRSSRTELVLEDLDLDPTDQVLARYLFRNCSQVRLRLLAGGYSGNVVAATASLDRHGHQQAPHVLKIGSLEVVRKEHDALRDVHEVLGNSVPQISAFAELNGRGAIKYRYASMGGGSSTTFQQSYMAGVDLDEVARVLEIVFGEQLMRLYRAAKRTKGDLLDLYGFGPSWAGSVRSKVERVLGRPAAPGPLEVLPGVFVHNVCEFYERDLAERLPRPEDACYTSFVHGDLNGSNILLDDRRNVWLIDFSHATRAHVLTDLLKLENDTLYVFTRLESDQDLRAAFQLTDALVDVEDLTLPLPEAPPSPLPQLERAWETLRSVRSFHARLLREDGDPYQLWVGLLRYAVHALRFEESGPLQRRWALYTAGRCVERIRDRLG